MRFIVFIGCLLFSATFSNAKNFYLCFNASFKHLLKKQKQMYMKPYLQANLNHLINEVSFKRQYEDFIVSHLSYYTILPNLGEQDNLTELAYFYLIAEEEKIIFTQKYCKAILETLNQYLKKVFLEYKNRIFYYELASNHTSEEQAYYEEQKDFLKYFEGHENVPLEKIGNIFQAVNNLCSLQ